MIGAGVGSLFGGAFIGRGRRKVLLRFNLLIIISTFLMCITNFWFILLGKLIFGFASGVV